MEMWTDKHATDYDSLHIFCFTAYYHVKESKSDPIEKNIVYGYNWWSKRIPSLVSCYKKDYFQ